MLDRVTISAQAAGGKLFDKTLDHSHRRHDVDLESLVPFRVVDRTEGSLRIEAGVIDQQIDGLALKFCSQPLDLAEIRHVQCMYRNPPCGRSRQGIQRARFARITATGEDAIARISILAHELQTDTAIGTGNQGLIA